MKKDRYTIYSVSTPLHIALPNWDAIYGHLQWFYLLFGSFISLSIPVLGIVFSYWMGGELVFVDK